MHDHLASNDNAPVASRLPDDAPPTDALVMTAVSIVRGDRTVLSGVDWTVGRHDRWIVLGANGCGKTTLARIAALYDHASSGTVTVLGETVGHTDVRTLRKRVGFVSSAFVDLIRPQLTARDVVMCALNAALEPWWHTYTDADRDAAEAALRRIGIGHLSGHAFGTLSSGERQRVQLARALMCDPELLVLDEPTAGLDLRGREEFVASLDAIDADGPALILVTHHLEEIPSSFDRVLIIGDGTVLASGPIEEHLTAAMLSRAAGIDLTIERHGGRWAARAGASEPAGGEG
ncbi:MAG: ATP-binding cassette domain-containing protein [Actinobacteria bacterium]|nr:ATP-binding cassette domain-containing protein [Actinomycetota bacterium]